MKKQKLKELLEQTKVEIADELDSFIEKIDSSTDDPNNFLTMTELEKQWKELSLKTHKIYSKSVDFKGKNQHFFFFKYLKNDKM